MSKLSLSSSVLSATLVAINSIGASTLAAKGREHPVDKKFAIHRKKRAVADVDVGILSNRRRHRGQWQHQKTAFDTNLHAENPLMCPSKDGYPGSWYLHNLFNETDSYFPKCSCPSPSTCGSDLCECLELDADGDILQCMDPLKQLCEGTINIDGIPGPWSMEECFGEPYGKRIAIYYCSYLPCFVDGGSFWECRCNMFDNFCTKNRDPRSCAMSKCCQAQTDDEGRKACYFGGYGSYYDQVTSLSISDEDIGNFTTSRQPSSAPSETTTDDSIYKVEASFPTSASALPGTSSASIPTLFGPESLTKTRVLAVAAITVWLFLT